MTVFEIMRDWLSTCPHLEQFTGGQHVDWTGPEPGNYGIMPTGSADVSVEEDVLGNILKTKQYNLALYARDWTIDDVVRVENTEFLDLFADWVEEQQWTGQIPPVGDRPEMEVVTAQNGMLFELSEDGQTGLYQIQIAVTYEKHYRRNS